ncbi:Myg1p RNJ42_01750 [Nakaseomyces bracarensis]|uniref:Myg1p n=1 Tax=Nakaseomyces bracarensis TaxID=273131 RepID=UPI003872982C
MSFDDQSAIMSYFVLFLGLNSDRSFIHFSIGSIEFLSSHKKATLMSDTKRVKLEMLQICTHSGPFHADESLAVYMLRLLPKYKDAKVVRSRNPEDWEASDIVVDVGAKYDGVKFFDHHQREFFETYNENYATKLSSAGLVYKHFGREIISTIISESGATSSESDLDILYDKVYKQFIEALDANDNGIDKYENSKDLTPKFKDTSISIPGIISGMNPSWNGDSSSEAYDKNFQRASNFVGEVFVDLVKGYALSWLPAKAIVAEAIKDRMIADASGKIVVLPQFCPWKEHLYEIEKEQGIEGQIEFVLFADSTGTWRISTVPVTSTSFQFRRGLPEHLRGLRDDVLSEKAGIPDGVFIHAAGFIGGAKSKESVYKLAKMSIA